MGKVTQRYPEGVYRNPKTVFEKLQNIGIYIDSKIRFYPYTTVYDFECFFDGQDLPDDTDLLHFQARHEAFSVNVQALCSDMKNQFVSSTKEVPIS